MKKHLLLALLVLGLALPAFPVFAAREPVVYTVVPGDTLWGLSERFFNDPHYWPNLWATNPDIPNPHFIYPGQKLRFYENRVEIVPESGETAAGAKKGAAATATSEACPPEQLVKGRDFLVSGSEGSLLEKDIHPAGFIISTQQNREIVGVDDIVYTDIGRVNGANIGDRYTIYKKMGPVSHPVTNVILGYKVIPLGELQLSEVDSKASKAIITNSYQEISPGAYLMPYREKRVTVPLKAADRDLVGYIVDTQTGNQAVAVGDIIFLDLGSSHGIKRGNLVYIVRDVTPDQRYTQAKVESLPVEVVGAAVVTDTGFNTSTAVIVKSVDTVYRGDRVELKRSR